jgi:hypothetical protein
VLFERRIITLAPFCTITKSPERERQNCEWNLECGRVKIETRSENNFLIFKNGNRFRSVLMGFLWAFVLCWPYNFMAFLGLFAINFGWIKLLWANDKNYETKTNNQFVGHIKDLSFFCKFSFKYMDSTIDWNSLNH